MLMYFLIVTKYYGINTKELNKDNKNNATNNNKNKINNKKINYRIKMTKIHAKTKTLL